MIGQSNHYFTRNSYNNTGIRVQRASGEEIDDAIDLTLVSVHLPITTNEKFATRHFFRSIWSSVKANDRRVR